MHRSADNELEPDRRFQSCTRGMKRDGPGPIADDSVRGNAAPGLECRHRRFSAGPEMPINSLRRCTPFGSTVRQHALELSNDISGRALFEKRHGPAVRQGSPGQRSNNTVRGEPGSFLKVFHGRFELRTEGAVHRNAGIWGSAERSLQTPDRSTGCANTDRRFAGIRHRLVSQTIRSDHDSPRHQKRKSHSCAVQSISGRSNCGRSQLPL